MAQQGSPYLQEVAIKTSMLDGPATQGRNNGDL